MAEPQLMIRSFRRASRHAARLPEREALLLRATLAYHTVNPDIPTAVGLLREATRRYPDDADAWCYLGDAYFHVGEQVLAAQDESEKAFRRVVELDPGFAPAYIHLVDNAVIHDPDSSRAARLIDLFAHLSPSSAFDEENRIAFGLLFGDPDRRRLALSALDTLPPHSLNEIADRFLDHPRFWAVREAVLEPRSRPAAAPGPQPGPSPALLTRPSPLMAFQRFDNSLSQGRIRMAIAHLEGPLTLPGIRAAGLYTIHAAGLPVPRPDFDRALALPPADSLPADVGSTMIAFYAGAYAADRRRWEAHAAASERLGTGADRLLAEGDSSGSRFVEGAAVALDARALWRRGEPQRALALLLDAQRRTTWIQSATHNALNSTIRWWLRELLLQLEKPQDEAPYFESFWNDPWAAWQLGRIYEGLGEPGKARHAYALIAFVWKDADPELQPRVREARAAVQRLTPRVRE